MRHFRVFYAGPPLSGRKTSLLHLAGRPKSEREFLVPPYRLKDEEIRLSPGETIRLDAMMPDFGSLPYDSFEQMTRYEFEGTREIAHEIIAFLPNIDGVIFVANSTFSPNDWNHRFLSQLLRELRIAGHEVDRLPIVFQCNWRDDLGAPPMSKLIAHLSTPRCAYVESVADLGYGVLRALESLVRLIDGDAPAGTTPKVAIESTENMPSSPHRLFENPTMDLTEDGEVRAMFRTSTRTADIVLDDAVVVSESGEVPLDAPKLAPGTYAVEVVHHLLVNREGKPWRVDDGEGEPWRFDDNRLPTAARIRRRDTTIQRRKHLTLERKDRVFVGPPAILPAMKDERGSNGALSHLQGIRIFAWPGSSSGVTARSEVAIFHWFLKQQVWLGYDEMGRVAEVTCLRPGAERALERLSPHASSA